MRSFAPLIITSIALAAVWIGCGSSNGATGSGGAGGASTAPGAGPGAGAGTNAGGGGPGPGSGGGGPSGSGPSGSGGAGAGGGPSNLPAGWLYTDGAVIKVADGSGSGTAWMGRGVNMDDIYLCGYNWMLETQNAPDLLLTMAGKLVSDWKPTFVRVSLGMNSYPTSSSWLGNAAAYKTPMTNVIEGLGANAGVYVLVTLRSDASMIGCSVGNDATCVPTDASNTPNANQFPSGTDAVYQALVDTFAHDKFVLFGVTNEPGGNSQSNQALAAAMSHAVSVIRAEEDMLGVPHHLVSVQGNGWTSDISFYAQTPLSGDNIVYEVHGYPPAPSSYTYANIPVILGEYGSLSDSNAFYADVEAKGIPNLAWDFESFSNCSPDLLTVNDSATNLQPTSWGDTVKQYLAMHAQ